MKTKPFNYFTIGQVIYYPSGERLGTVECISEYTIGSVRHEVAFCKTEGGHELEVNSTALMAETVFTREGLQRKGLSRAESRVALPKRGAKLVTFIGKGARIFLPGGDLMIGVINRFYESDVEPGGLYAQTDLHRVVRPSHLNEGAMTLGARTHK